MVQQSPLTNLLEGGFVEVRRDFSKEIDAKITVFDHESLIKQFVMWVN